MQRPGPDARIQQSTGRSELVPSPAAYAQVLRLEDQGLGVTKTSDSKHLHGWAAATAQLYGGRWHYTDWISSISVRPVRNLEQSAASES